MKKLSLVAALVALVMAPGIVRAEDDAEKKDKDIDIRVETKVSGEVMTIGPDGKVKVEKFGDDGKMEGVESLPKNIQKLLKKGRLGAGSVGGSITVIGPDGKMEGVESLPKNIQELLKQAKPGTVSVDGSVTIIGPDGKKHTHALGDGKLDAESISKSIEEALQGAGKGLPKEIQGQLKEALKGLPGALKVQIGGATPKEKDTMSQKLDEILKRLDKLEKEVKDLKANNK
jgi:hypothetical protein